MFFARCTQFGVKRQVHVFDESMLISGVRAGIVCASHCTQKKKRNLEAKFLILSLYSTAMSYEVTNRYGHTYVAVEAATDHAMHGRVNLK